MVRVEPSPPIEPRLLVIVSLPFRVYVLGFAES